jgi:glucokinase
MNYIGIDIGGTSIKLGLIRGFEIAVSHNVTTVNGSILFDTIRAVHELCKKAKIELSSVAGIGITIPGPVANNQVSVLANIQVERPDIYEALVEAFPSTPLLLLNDANAAAIGEVSRITPRVKDAVMLTIGTGLGGGIISNYHVIEGAFGQGGELGHVTIHSPYQFQCGCGKVDCAETILSATGIRRLATSMKASSPTKINASSNVKQIFKYAKAGDAFAIQVVEEWAKYMARLILQLAVITNPSVVIFGGGVANAGDFLIDKVQQAFDRQLAWPNDHRLVFQLAHLGNDAGMIGAVQALIQGAL